MRIAVGRVNSINLDSDGRQAAWITCPSGQVPAPGQYMLAQASEGYGEYLAYPLFPGELGSDGFLAAPPLPTTWRPGAELVMCGPVGNGFNLPVGVRNLGLVALGDTVLRLMPLLSQVDAVEAAVALFADCRLPRLPETIEAHPLAALPESLAWADMLAIDLPLAKLPELHDFLGLETRQSLPCQAQVLVFADIACGGLAECGVCAVPARRGYKLACIDGPVFDLNELEW